MLRTSLGLLVTAVTILASEPGSFYRKLDVSGPVQLEVRSDPGGVNVTVGTSGFVRVRGVIKPLYGRLDLNLAQANIFALEQNPPIDQVGNHIRVGYVKDPGLLRGVSLHLEIETPRRTRVQAQTTSGAIRIDGIDGPIETVTASGRTEISNAGIGIKVVGKSGAIIIRDTSGQVSARNESGGIQLMSIHGTVESETTSGRTEISDVWGEVQSTTRSGGIIIDNARDAVVAHNSSGSIDLLQIAGPIHAETKSGRIRVSQVTPAPIRALSGSGAIHVELANRGGYSIDAQSDSGKVSGPVTNTSSRTADAHRLKAQIGSCGPLVDLDTHSSQIEIN